MIEINEQVLAKMAQAVVREVDPEKIILFGSRASGLAGPDSDVDLLIIERDPFGPGRSRWREMNRVRKSLSSFRVAKDILVYSREEMEQWRHSLNHIIGTSLREGKVLYERP